MSFLLMLSTAEYVMHRWEPRGTNRRVGTACTRRVLNKSGEETSKGQKKQAEGGERRDGQ